MSTATNRAQVYRGFEQGPIRPPSEARSLLIRVTRSCPWNRCTFCPVYKETTFSFRPVEHVKRDIDTVYRHVEKLRELADSSGPIEHTVVQRLIAEVEPGTSQAFAAAVHWFLAGGKKSVFLQDANSLAARAVDLVDVLKHLKAKFPFIHRTTSYARAQTIAARKASDLKATREAGLERIHIGLESGSDEVLQTVKKGATKKQHIRAGLKAKEAGMELSEYVMPGLGGRPLSDVHALETADALNQINPDFIRLRTLAISPRAPLFEEWKAGRFEKCTDVEVVREILTLIENLDGITSVIKSDHVLNLFSDLQGRLPDDRERMTTMLGDFLAMDPGQQRLFQIGKRLGIFSGLRDVDNAQKLAHLEQACRQLSVTPENVDEITDRIVTTYV